MIWDPQIPGLGSEERVQSAYIIMWQVQAGIAAVALPILLFVIELSKEEKSAAMRSHEVVIRETWIFPIIVSQSQVPSGLDLTYYGFPKKLSFLIDFVLVFLVTIIFVVLVYFSALSLLFSPARMKTRGMKVAREKMSESLDASIEIRIANNLLFQNLDKLISHTKCIETGGK